MRHLTGITAIIGNLWLAGAALLHFYYAGWGYPEPLKLATLHLTLFLPAIFILFPAHRTTLSEDIEDENAPPPSILDWVLAAVSIVPPLYAYLNPERVYDRAVFISPLTDLEVVLACVMVVLVLEGVRRALSIALSILAGLTILYMFIAHLLPGMWNYRNMPLSHIAETMYMMNGSGLFGLLTGISATIVATFLIFGAFLQQSGIGKLFMTFGNLLAGRLSGGPAKVAVITSALFGSTSGSSVANVVVTGSVTIPMMKKLGFKGSLAAGTEASASVGGLIMPPVMGAAAFVMAELIQVPYWDIVTAAFLGGVLYFFGILVSVHYLSKRLGIEPLPKSEMPHWKDLLPDIHLAIPLVILVTMMAMRFSAYHAAFYSTIAIVIVSWLRPHTRMYPSTIFRALVHSGATIAIIAVAVTCAGIIMASLTNTGLILAFGGIVTELAGDSVMLLVLILAALCLLLGMGVPTTPAYIITSAIGTPILAGATDASLLQIHLFVFYFAVLADATPPVAAASYAAAAIAKANPLASGGQAFRMAIGGFIAGFSFLFAPGLTLEAPLLEIILTFTGLCASVTLFSIGSIGYVVRRLNLPLRLFFTAAGLFCALGHEILPMETRAIIAFVLLAFAYLWEGFSSRALKRNVNQEN
ncbi:TRAP transporter permease [Algicella marina]|uniref:TRAP transporter fused permease subunit n=1 Tax=Algicella marina TaxID=2683284 RepID=A0A6P1T1A6_9RHOB|nr:TRAP transporter fused permease subunit [Algicella marina]QHQ35423.1 TRAP transporter fused permease subunit [Algicella marina]